MSEDEGRKRRETFRQEEVLPIKVERLTFEQFRVEMNKPVTVSQHARMIQDLMNHDSSDRFDSLSPDIAAALQSLDQKLNFLIAMQVEKMNDTKYEQRHVDLSSTGIGFTTRDRYKQGDRLKIMLNLPLFPPVSLELLGKVASVKVVPEDRGTVHVGVQFLHRSEQDEEMLLKYLFKRQRERIRAKEAHKSLSEKENEELQPGI